MRGIGAGDGFWRRLPKIGPIVAAAVVFVLVLVGAGCAGAGGGAGAIEDARDYPARDIEIMVPSDPGGGYDETGRLMERALTEGDVVDQNVEVFNLPGAGGAIGLTELVNDDRGDPYTLMIMGASMVGAIKTTDVPFSLRDTTPIARLAAEYSAIVVPADSKYQNIEQLVEDFKADPGSISWGGGSQLGGIDHVPVVLLAQEVGVDPADTSFVSYDGAGELIPGLLSGDVDAGASGVPEFIEQVEAGEVRMLAVTSAEPIEGVDAPTLVESGYDVTLVNWRGVVAPPGITEEHRDAIIAMVEKMHETPQWQEALRDNDWDDVFLTGDEFAEYVKSEDEEATRLLKDLGVIE